MPANEGNAPKNFLACDTCYKRKVKCDRKTPCKNCISAKATCQWTRQIRVRRRKPNTADAVRTLEHRVQHLESLLQQSGRSERVARADRDDRMEADSDLEPTPNEDISRQDDSRNSMSSRKSNSLSRPLRLMDALAGVREAERIFSRFKPSYREQESEGLTSTDILNAMTRPSNDPTGLIPHFSVTKMGLALLSNPPIPNPEKVLYQIIMTFKAALALGEPAQTTTHAVTHHIKRIQACKFEAILTAFRKLGVAPPPSLSLLQAQCVKVAVLQFFGDVAAARNMMGSVSQTLEELGYSSTESDEAVTSCVRWCYQCDSSMGVFLRLPRVLPPFKGDRGLDVSKELLYHLQDRVLHLAAQQLNMTQRALEIEKLDREIKAHPDMQKEDTKLDFRLFATLTVLWHSHPDLSSQNHVQTQLTGCEADITLHWDILCSGVLPMLIVCVHTLRVNDGGGSNLFQLLKGYASVVSGLQAHYNRSNHLANQVHQLCNALVQICEAVQAPGNIATNHTPFRKNFLNFDSFFVTSRQEDDGEDDDDDDHDGDDHDDDQLDAMVAGILTMQPQIYNFQLSPDAN
ncbi:putative transcriptional regulatory protein C530,08 [Talaromyces islandicus]|uniref:Putative transcriptional regulatory protein C530,08 n=1 Tax=Talaromyces islandicus TaxID=28573 RepID=A0A0U1M779_TALIS|nr:putative transcriptional regulatory protein C530,08 [Talaromyces islandicus]